MDRCGATRVNTEPGHSMSGPNAVQFRTGEQTHWYLRRSASRCVREKGDANARSAARLHRPGAKVKGSKIPIGPLDWRFRSTFGHHPAWLSHSSTSACAGSSVSFCLAGKASRTRTSRSWCSGTRCVFSNASCTPEFAIGLPIGRSSLHSADCFLEDGGGPSWSPPTRCCDGTGKRANTNGGDGESNVILVGRR